MRSKVISRIALLVGLAGLLISLSQGIQNFDNTRLLRIVVVVEVVILLAITAVVLVLTDR